MRLRLGRSRSKRPRQRGVAVIEFSLALVFFVPLILGILDYGYYFYVAVNVVEATRIGARQVALQNVGNCANVAAVAAARAVATATMLPGPPGPATAYMNNQTGMGLKTTVTASCGTVPSDPTWNFKVQVDFPPAVGFLRAGMHPSVAVPGDVEFSQTVYIGGK
jgi:Flp pilus assembly protein TadG